MLNLTSTELSFAGPALPEAFVQHELEQALGKALPPAKDAEPAWRALLKALHEPLANAGAIRVRNLVLGSLLPALGYAEIVHADPVRTREGDEAGGWLLQGKAGTLRAWTTEYEADLDAPTARGLNHRFSPGRIAERVLLATGERLGLLTNGVELRVIFSDPARRASFASFALSQWRQYRYYDPVPDSFRLLLAFARPAGQKVLPDVLEQARLKQGQVTKDLRVQARQAIEAFVQGVLDHPANTGALAAHDREKLAKTLWREALIVVYRLLFILRGESGGRETPPFLFASTSLWRNTYSPSHAQPGNLAWAAQKVREEGLASGEFLESGLRALFRAFERGVDSAELHIAPLGGALFGAESTPLLDTLRWGEHGCAELLDNLLRAPRGKGKARSLVRLSYRDLDVEELGRVYEALLELEPGITAEPMVRLRRAKLEVVVPEAQGEKYRSADALRTWHPAPDSEDDEEPDESEDEEEAEGRKSKTKIEWIEAIPVGRFYLRVGLGRKASGAYYTPESFVKFLVQETLGPQCDKVSPADDPQPRAILKLNVLDPAMGSGHFLVGACRFLGERLYDACAECARRDLWDRVPDEVVPYLPGRRPEGESEAGFSVQKARALCKRLVAVHCLYGVDKNPLAVELAKVSLWLESFAEGLPLTFLDHRLVCGDSLLGPVNIVGEGPDSPMTAPYATTPMDQALAAGVRARLRERLAVALQKVQALDATVGTDADDIAAKQRAKAELDEALRPFVELCTAWAGGVMLGPKKVDEGGYRYALCLLAAGNSEIIAAGYSDPPAKQMGALDQSSRLVTMLAKGRAAVVLMYPLAFPEVFFSEGVDSHSGFDAVLGNPPWDSIQFKSKEFLASFDIEVLNAATKRERAALEQAVLSHSTVAAQFETHRESFEELKRSNDVLYRYQKVQIEGDLAGRQVDSFRVFMERGAQLLGMAGVIGLVVPSAFHANEGATGIRKMYFEQLRVDCCYSFENRRKLFEIDSRFKFAIVVASHGESTREFSCGFYLHDTAWLFGQQKDRPVLRYTLEFIRRTSGEYLTLLELQDPGSVQLAQVAFAQGVSFGEYCRDKAIRLQKQPVALDMAKETHRFRPVKQYMEANADPRYPEGRSQLLQQEALYLVEGKTFHQFDELWGDRPRYCVPLSELDGNPVWLDPCRFFRLAFRAIASSTNERTAIFCVLSPVAVAGHSVALERDPQDSARCEVLAVSAAANSYVFDWCLRIMASANVGLFVMNNVPLVISAQTRAFLAHASLRLTCMHSGYASLWSEQLGSAWREPTPPHTWPVIASDDARWEVRAAIDAVVADAYGLTREQYAHVLASFSHKSYPQAPALCLAKFDELHAIGLEAFTRKYDPYWDIPLVETLPTPVIELPAVGQQAAGSRQRAEGAEVGQRDMFGNVVAPKGKSRKGKRK